MFGNPGAGRDLRIVLLGIAIAGFVIGIAWLRRITREPEDGDDSWRFRR